MIKCKHDRVVKIDAGHDTLELSSNSVADLDGKSPSSVEWCVDCGGLRTSTRVVRDGRPRLTWHEPARRGPTDAQIDWLASGDTGLSSNTLWAHMTGTHPAIALGNCSPCRPSDSGDFGRCSRLLDRFPEWRARMAEMEPVFGKLATHWAEVEALYRAELAKTAPSGRTWARMRELAGEAPLRPRQTSEVTMTVNGQTATIPNVKVTGHAYAESARRASKPRRKT